MMRNINENTSLQAASPAIEINRLFSMMGVGLDTLKMLAWVIVFVSGLSIFISLLGSLKDRKYELALMRVMGASRTKLFTLILFEGLLIAVIGYFLGLALSHISIEYSGHQNARCLSIQHQWSGFSKRRSLAAGRMSSSRSDCRL